MGWRDRDYARWTEDERRHFLGSSASVPASPGRSRRGGLIAPGAGVAILASAALVAAGHLPQSHPLIGALDFKIPVLQERHADVPAAYSVSGPQVRALRGPKTAVVGASLTFRGTAPAGTIHLDGTYGLRPAWHQLASASVSQGGTYVVRIVLRQRGLLHLRVMYPDGSRSTGAIRVR
jgi:hypothetical protein